MIDDDASISLTDICNDQICQWIGWTGSGGEYVDSWKVMIREWSKFILMRSRGWVDICWHSLTQVDVILGTINGHIQVAGLDVNWQMLLMIVADDYHDLVYDIGFLLYMSCISFNVKVMKIPNF